MMRRPEEPTDALRHLPLTPLTYEVLLVLASAPLHGYGIIKAISNRTGGETEPETGTLYTAIKRLVDDALIEPAEPAEGAEVDRRRRYYALTPLGRKVLTAESQRLARLVAEARALRLVGPEVERGA